MSGPVALADCTFTASPNNSGQFVGRCREFPELRTRPYRSRLDAIDAIVDAVRDQIRHRDAFAEVTRRYP